MRRLPTAAVALALFVHDGPAEAIGEARKGDLSMEAMGNVRLLGAYLHYPDAPGILPAADDGLVVAVVRLMLEGDLGSHVGYETNLFADLTRSPDAALGGSLATAGSFDTPYRTKYLSWGFWRSGSVTGTLGVDRLSFDLMFSPVTFTVGRFPINHSVTFAFTTNDFFAPFSASAVNKLYKPGVDALRLSVATGMLSTVELDAVMGYGTTDAPSWGRSALIARLATVLFDFEWALMGGKVANRWVVAASLQGQLGPLGLRGEGHLGIPDHDGDGHIDGDRGIYGRMSAGMNVLVPWHNISIDVEYAFMSDGAGRTFAYLDRATRFYPDDPPYMGRHYVGLGVSGEIIPILVLSAMGLFNAEDSSGLFVASLDYSLADEVSFVGGVLVPWGERPVADSGPPYYEPSLESEFGVMPFTLYLETRFFF